MGRQSNRGHRLGAGVEAEKRFLLMSQSPQQTPLKARFTELARLGPMPGEERAGAWPAMRHRSVASEPRL